MAIRRTTWIAGMAAVGILVGYSVGRASSPFPAGQNAPVIFSGNMSSSGAPLSGSHQLSMNLWRANDTSLSSNQVCQGTTQDVTMDNGNFQLQLDATCVSAFLWHAQLWHQLVIDGTAFPLQQVGSVPYALRSSQESSNGTRLGFQRDVTYGADGFHGEISRPLWDTQRNEECFPQQTGIGDGGPNPDGRCLPSAAGDRDRPHQISDSTVSTWFSDAACTQPYPTGPGLRYFKKSGWPLKYVADLDNPDYWIPSVVAMYEATEQCSSPYEKSTGCVRVKYTETICQYTLGAAIPLTEFVETRKMRVTE